VRQWIEKHEFKFYLFNIVVFLLSAYWGFAVYELARKAQREDVMLVMCFSILVSAFGGTYSLALLWKRRK
jgi:hypothetical protein